MENYFASQRDHIFRNVEVLIYVFDVESRELEKDMHYYQSCLEAILQNSRDAKIFCLVHKMDLVQEDQRDMVRPPGFAREGGLLCRPLGLCRARGGAQAPLAAARCHLLPHINMGRDSLQSASLLAGGRRGFLHTQSHSQAWSSIVYSLIPNVKLLESHLNTFCNICEADEVVLFERATFLVISHATSREHRDVHRFEKISNIIKQFKLSCSKSQAQFQSMEVRNTSFTAFIDFLTTNTYVMVIQSDPSIRTLF